MTLGDKISNKAENLTGKGKEAAGNITGDDELAAEGRADQAKAAVEDVKETVDDVVGKVKDIFKK